MTTNFSHTSCTHPSTSKARAACRKAHASGVTVDLPRDLLATAPVFAPTLPTNDHLTTSEHMGRNDAVRITQDLLNAHGLNGWRVVFIAARRKAGHCNYARREIALSAPLMQQRSYADTHSTITHEIAHALTPGHKHDHVWAAQHRALGGNGLRCFDHTDEEAPFLGTCPHGKVFSKYRAPRPGAVFRCKCVRGNREGFTFAPNPNA